jgi:hypothetical protein
MHVCVCVCVVREGEVVGSVCVCVCVCVYVMEWQALERVRYTRIIQLDHTHKIRTGLESAAMNRDDGKSAGTREPHSTRSTAESSRTHFLPGNSASVRAERVNRPSWNQLLFLL